jgi:hypothetical protein
MIAVLAMERKFQLNQLCQTLKAFAVQPGRVAAFIPPDFGSAENRHRRHTQEISV